MGIQFAGLGRIYPKPVRFEVRWSGRASAHMDFFPGVCVAIRGLGACSRRRRGGPRTVTQMLLMPCAFKLKETGNYNPNPAQFRKNAASTRRGVCVMRCPSFHFSSQSQSRSRRFQMGNAGNWRFYSRPTCGGSTQFFRNCPGDDAGVGAMVGQCAACHSGCGSRSHVGKVAGLKSDGSGSGHPIHA